MRTHPWGRIGDDSGVALLTVIGVMLVVTILAVGSFVLANQSLHESSRVEDEGRAFRVASSGLETVLSTFDETLIGGAPITGSTPDGSYAVTVEDVDGMEYQLRSVGTGADGQTETVIQRFYFMNLWKMNFAGAGPQSLISGSSGLHGTSNIIGPFYMKGNFDIKANMGVFEGPLFVFGGVGFGNVTVHSNSWLGHPDEYIKVYATGNVPDNRSGGGQGRGVYVSSLNRSVPDVMLPPMSWDDMRAAADKAIEESVDNLMGPATRTPAVANLEYPYLTLQPPNTGTWTRSRPDNRVGANPNYKFIGPADNSIATKGAGTTSFTIGGRNFGAWGSVTTTDGVNLSGPGPTGVGGYPANTRDDFAYDNTRKILFIDGTVFVDGPVTFSEDMTYIGNGTIVANGDITVNGYLRPYGTNTQGENNKWALGLATPGSITFNHGGDNSYMSMDRPQLRAATPIYAGAFYAEDRVHFANGRLMVRGTVLTGKMDFPHTNNYLITNPLLPSYLPGSLPGINMNLLIPGLWTRG